MRCNQNILIETQFFRIILTFEQSIIPHWQVGFAHVFGKPSYLHVHVSWSSPSRQRGLQLAIGLEQLSIPDFTHFFIYEQQNFPSPHWSLWRQFSHFPREFFGVHTPCSFLSRVNSSAKIGIEIKIINLHNSFQILRNVNYLFIT